MSIMFVDGVYLNPRRAGWHTLQVFFLTHLFIQLSRTCEHFRPRSFKVRYPDHVRWPHLRKVWKLVIATPHDRSPQNFQRLIPVKVSMKCASLNFENFVFWRKPIRNTLKHRVMCRLDTLSRNIATRDPSSCRQGHFRSWKVISSVSAITFDRDQV